MLFVISMIAVALESISFAFCNASFISSCLAALPFFTVGGTGLLRVLAFFACGRAARGSLRLVPLACRSAATGSDDEVPTVHPKYSSFVIS